MKEKYENAEMKVKSPFGEKIENFFYHYKWHTIVALFLVFTIVICSLQMCAKTSYDVHIMYAGGEEIGKTAAGGDISEYQKINSALMKVTPDFDKNGERNVNFLSLFIPSAEEIEQIQNTEGYELNISMVLENQNIFEQNILYSEYSICFLSEALFLEWSENKGLTLFADIEEFTNGNKEDYEFVNNCGIKLSSTSLYESAGMKILPEDTVVCIRVFSEVSSRFNKTENRENYRRSVEVLKEMLKNG